MKKTFENWMRVNGLKLHVSTAQLKNIPITPFTIKKKNQFVNQALRLRMAVAQPSIFL